MHVALTLLSATGACSAMSETECRHIAITSETRGACFISLLEEFMWEYRQGIAIGLTLSGFGMLPFIISLEIVYMEIMKRSRMVRIAAIMNGIVETILFEDCI